MFADVTRMDARSYCLRKPLITDTEKQISKADRPTTGCIEKPERVRIGVRVSGEAGACNETNDRDRVCADNDFGCGLGTATLAAHAAAAENARGKNARGEEEKSVSGKKLPAKNVRPPTAPQVPAQIMPPVPATLMNSAPVQPSVTMEGGMLTIDAPNSTLSDVLSGVRKATGAAIEGASPSERVAVRLGPGKPAQVISALLRGTPYDYVILGGVWEAGRGHAGVADAIVRRANARFLGMRLALRKWCGRNRLTIIFSASPPLRKRNRMRAKQSRRNLKRSPSHHRRRSRTRTRPKTPEQLFKELQQLEQQKQQTADDKIAWL